MSTSSDLRVYADAPALAAAAAEWLCGLAEASQGRFAISLAGGSTPRPLYARLAEAPLRDRFPWQRAHWFWGDERCVPTDHPDSNYRMVREALLDHVPVPAENIHPVRTQPRSPEESATDYEGTLRDFCGEAAADLARALFNVTLLGLGDDGHTASLLPHQPVLEERRRWVAAVPQGRGEPRVTLTYPALERSAHVAFLVSGAAKRAALTLARAGGDSPAGRLRPMGQLLWFADRAAAGT